MKILSKTLAILVTMVFVVGAVGCSLLNMNKNEKVNVKIETIKDGKEFTAEVADTAAEMEQGLKYRESMSDDEAMLFDLKKPAYASLWMKDTLIPLDMIFIDENMLIVDMFKDVQPCKTEKCDNYASEHKVRYLLEINGGLADEYNINLGDKIIISEINE